MPTRYFWPGLGCHPEQASDAGSVNVRIEEAYAAREARLKAQAQKEGKAAAAEQSAGEAGEELDPSSEDEAQGSAEESPQLAKDESPEAPD